MLSNSVSMTENSPIFMGTRLSLSMCKVVESSKVLMPGVCSALTFIRWRYGGDLDNFGHSRHGLEIQTDVIKQVTFFSLR